MVQFTSTFDIPDDQMPRIIAAMREHFGQTYDITLVPNGAEGEMMEVPVYRDRTPAELVEKIREVVIGEIKRIVATTEAATAERNAKADMDTLLLG